MIIGGGISQEKGLMIPEITKRMESRLPPGMMDEISVLPARLANDAAIIGAVAPLMK